MNDTKLNSNKETPEFERVLGNLREQIEINNELTSGVRRFANSLKMLREETSPSDTKEEPRPIGTLWDYEFEVNRLREINTNLRHVFNHLKSLQNF